jgi:hypothetical protein
MLAVAEVWVGGRGFLFFTNPRLACRLSRCNDPAARRLKCVKAVGAVELSLVFPALVLTAIFGLNSGTGEQVALDCL